MHILASRRTEGLLGRTAKSLQAPEPEPASSWAEQQLALEQLVDQLPAAQATALRLTVLEGLSLRAAAERLEINAMSVQRAQKKALAALRQQLEA